MCTRCDRRTNGVCTVDTTSIRSPSATPSSARTAARSASDPVRPACHVLGACVEVEPRRPETITSPSVVRARLEDAPLVVAEDERARRHDQPRIASIGVPRVGRVEDPVLEREGRHARPSRGHQPWRSVALLRHQQRGRRQLLDQPLDPRELVDLSIDEPFQQGPQGGDESRPDVEPVEVERDRRHRVHAADDRPGHGSGAIIVLRAAPPGREEIAGEQPVVRFDRGPVLVAFPAHADPDDDRLEPCLVQLRDHRPEVRIPSSCRPRRRCAGSSRAASAPRSSGAGRLASIATRSSRSAFRRRRSAVAGDSRVGRRRRTTPRRAVRSGSSTDIGDVEGRAPPPPDRASGSPMVSTRRPSAWRTSSSASRSPAPRPIRTARRRRWRPVHIATAVARGASARAARGRGTSTSRPRRAGGPPLRWPPPSDRPGRATCRTDCALRAPPRTTAGSRRHRTGPRDPASRPGRGPPWTARAPEAARLRPTPRRSAESVVRAREERLSGRVPTGWWEPVSYPNAQPPQRRRDRSGVRARASTPRCSPIVAQARRPLPRSARVRPSAGRRRPPGSRAPSPPKPGVGQLRRRVPSSSRREPGTGSTSSSRPSTARGRSAASGPRSTCSRRSAPRPPQRRIISVATHGPQAPTRWPPGVRRGRRRRRPGSPISSSSRLDRAGGAAGRPPRRRLRGDVLDDRRARRAHPTLAGDDVRPAPGPFGVRDPGLRARVLPMVGPMDARERHVPTARPRRSPSSTRRLLQELLSRRRGEVRAGVRLRAAHPPERCERRWRRPRGPRHGRSSSTDRPRTPRNAFPAIVDGLRAGGRRTRALGLGRRLGRPAAPDIDLGVGDPLLARSESSTSTATRRCSGESAIGISLMVSPHPSYPPLEMAHLGHAGPDQPVRSQGPVDLAFEHPGDRRHLRRGIGH